MLGLEHDADPLRRQLLLEPVRNLHGEALLDLKPARKRLDDTRELGEADDALTREVRHVGDSVKRQKVVLAQRVERDLAHEHELVVVLVVRERRRLERFRGQELRVSRRDAAGRIA
jgi:hypothetical protein